MTERPKFEEIDVERINIVEADGTLRFAIANNARVPDAVIAGRVIPGRQGSGAAMIYYNDDGTEAGGFACGGGRARNGHGAVLTFDGFEKDQQMMLSFEDAGNGVYGGGLSFLDRADLPLTEAIDDLERVKAMADGPDKDKAMRELEEKHWIRQRLGIGREADGTVGVNLCDTKGRPRIRMFVGPDDEPRLQFLDAEGNVTFSLPPVDA